MNWSDPSVVVTIGIACVTLIYTVLTGLIWYATLQNTKATREILEAEHRPYIGVVQVRFKPEGTIGSATLQITIKNVGTVPSGSIHIDFEIRLNNTATSSTGPETRRPSLVLMPGNTLVIPHELTDEEMGCFRGENVFQVAVKLRYHGMTDKEYRSSGTYQYDGIESFLPVSGELT